MIERMVMPAPNLRFDWPLNLSASSSSVEMEADRV
jgi:hypothetical protein